MNDSDESLASLLPLQSTVDKLIKKTNLALVVGTNSWREQFIEAITVSAGKFVCFAYGLLFYKIIPEPYN